MFERSDRIRIETRLLAVIVVPILIMAFIYLYFLQPRSAELFAWEINPPIMAAFVGAGYLGGSYYFIRVIFERRWHRVAAGLWPVGAFVWFMFLTTILHWERFDKGHFPFQLWLAIYSATPFLIPIVWWRNRPADPGTPEAVDATVPDWLRLLTGGIGAIFFAFALVCFLFPDFVAGFWFWKISPLMTRVLGGWSALMGTGGLMLFPDRRWSAWRIQIESMFVWHFLVVIACFANLGDFHQPLNFFVIGESAGLLGFIAIYVHMTRRARVSSESQP
jgi:hypothetical protein